MKVLLRALSKVLLKEHLQKCSPKEHLQRCSFQAPNEIFAAAPVVFVRFDFVQSALQRAPSKVLPQRAPSKVLPKEHLSKCSSKSTFKSAPQRAPSKVLAKEHLQKCFSMQSTFEGVLWLAGSSSKSTFQSAPLARNSIVSAAPVVFVCTFFVGVNKSEKLRMNLSGS